MLLANDEQNSRPRGSFAGSKARRQLFALQPGPYSSAGKLVTVDVKRVVWFPNVDKVVRETPPVRVVEVLNIVLDVLVNGGPVVVLNVDVVSVKVVVLRGADVVMEEVSEDSAKEVLDKLVVDVSVDDIEEVVDSSEEFVNEVLERVVVEVSVNDVVDIVDVVVDVSDEMVADALEELEVDVSVEDVVNAVDVSDEFASDVLDRLVVDGSAEDVVDIVVEVSDEFVKEVLETLVVGASVVDVFEKNVKDIGVPVVILEVVELLPSVEVVVVAVASMPEFEVTKLVGKELVVLLVAVALGNPVELLDVVSSVNVVEEEVVVRVVVEELKNPEVVLLVVVSNVNDVKYELLDKLEDRLELRLVDILEERLLDKLLDILEKQLAGQGDVAED
ncbi:hypothetical protein GLAREA_03698 [Glarea lozoyensis ATCC 20868]|uniref:Uncharacterized protein n=1 Tax=Glarea lozoyensis (strain ATCC 20868 / MF5171) TaxID=1116229 RepID=S3DFI6_GLAL2|nr:uncharacterized protein GLAREA_03698 [Glarea lozoyensis ATCC 20868]EPE30731.1 hypothetical protein GLAREA_03698 [Glarea lozoyensis ATCC 20868]